MAADDIARESLKRVTSTFIGSRPKRQRAKPHRCLDCGKVTRHVRCHDCTGVTSCSVCGWTKAAS
jgi:predicted RNA-binding Zn-ribbon protein involved in translation (DUF1610 family)